MGLDLGSPRGGAPGAPDERRRLLRLNGALREAFARGGGKQVVLQASCRALVDNLGAAFARIWTLDPGEGVLRLQASAGMYTHLDGPHSTIRVGELKIGLIAADRRPHITNDVAVDPRISDPEWALREHMVAFAGHPLVVGQRVVGVMALFARHRLSTEVLEELGSISDTIAQFVDRERTAALLRECDEQYRRVFEATLDGLVIANPDDGSIVEVNAAMSQIFDQPRRGLLGKPLAMLFRRDDRRAVAELIASARQQGGSQKRLRVPSRTNDSIHVDLKATTLAYQGSPHVLGVVRDVTHEALAYKLLETRVAERTREVANLVAVSRDVSTKLELGSLLAVVLEHLERTLDYTAAAVLGLRGDDLTVREYRGPVPRDQVCGTTVRRADLGLEAKPAQPAVVKTGPVPAGVAAMMLGLPVEGPGSYMAVPVAAQDRVLAFLVILHRETGRYDVHQADLALVVAQQAAVAMEIARLYEESRERARLEERQRLARELHDSVSQDLYAIALGAQTGLRAASGLGDVELIDALRDIRSLSAGAIAEMRALIFELRPESLEQEGVVPAIAKLGSALAARYQIAVDVELGPEPALEISDKEALYRICQEALTNVAKHAAAARVGICLAQASNGGLELTITDDGMGFESDRDYPGHLGLRSMRERAEARGWSLEIRSQFGLGTTLVVRTRS